MFSMKIAFVAAESKPLIKTGGLGDVIESLAKEETKLGEEVRIIIPFYKKIRSNPHYSFTKILSFSINLSWRKEEVEVYETKIDDVIFYLIYNERYFNRDAIYGEFDDGERFAFFTLAAKELFHLISYQPDIIHIHDWHVGMLPVIVKESTDENEYLKNAKFVLTIHNPAFQGLYPKTILGDFYNLSDSVFENGKVRFKGQVSTLKAGIIYADKITTVSPNHRLELLSSEGGMGLDTILKLREWDFEGIVNGIDYDEFNPLTDKYIEFKYDEKSFLEAKEKNKDNLLRKMKLVNTGKPLFGIVSRLTWQKGMDLFLAMAYSLAKNGCNIVILGSGEYNLEQEMEKLRSTYPNTVGIYIGFNNELAHQIYASCDFFLMPSLFEPCGIGQLIAERYGALPIVRLTGGLKDTVINFDGNNQNVSNGFGFSNYSNDEAIRTAFYAYDNYWNLPLRSQLIYNAMTTDNSWEKSAKKYIQLYKTLI